MRPLWFPRRDSVRASFVCALVLLSVSSCARDEHYRLSYMVARYRQAWQEVRQADVGDPVISAASVLRGAGYPLAPEMLSEVERVMGDLATLCPHFTIAAIARSLARKYTVPWHQVEASARRVGALPYAHDLRMLLMVHDGMLEEAKATYCGERAW